MGVDAGFFGPAVSEFVPIAGEEFLEIGRMLVGMLGMLVGIWRYPEESGFVLAVKEWIFGDCEPGGARVVESVGELHDGMMVRWDGGVISWRGGGRGNLVGLARRCGLLFERNIRFEIGGWAHWRVREMVC